MSEYFDYNYKFVLYSDYDADGDGYLSPSEYDAYKAAGGIDYEGLPKITQAELDAIEAETSGTSVSPYEDGSAANNFYGSFSEAEVNEAIIDAAEAGDIDVIQQILNTAGSVVNDVARNAALNAVYTATLGDVVPQGFEIGSGGSSGRVDFGTADLSDLTSQYLTLTGGNPNNSADVREAERMALEQHIQDTLEARQTAEQRAAELGGNWWDYYQLPNRAVELSQEFKDYDLDGDGVLNAQEMEDYTKDWEEEAGLLRFADDPDSSATAATIEAADTDGDGNISPKELAAWEAARESDEESSSSRARREFLEDLGFDNSAAAAWMDDFSRQSGESFTSGAAQILQQSIQDASLGLLNSIQQGILTQIESGDDTITRPTLDKDDPSYAIIGQDIDSYLDRIFAGGDTVPKDTLLTNNEFYDVGIRLATSIQQTPMMDSNDIQIERTDQDLIRSLCSGAG